MASIIIHMAVTVRLLDICGINEDRDGYLAGTVLPDYNLRQNHHYKDLVGERRFFNLTRFREEQGDRLQDPVYMGYYFHLVQDMVFRDFMYNIHGFSPAERENVLKLYTDYQRLNGYLARRYDIPVEILKNMDRIPSDRYPDFPLNRAELEDETDRYHNVDICPEGEHFFFTPQMADEYVERATEACLWELGALKGEKEHIDEMQYSWIRFFK